MTAMTMERGTTPSHDRAMTKQSFTHSSLILVVLFVCASGCAQSFLKGATLTKKDLSSGSVADFTVSDCRDVATGAAVENPTGVTYHLVDFRGQVGLFEKVKGGSSVITNSWREADGTHFFVYVMANGWEFIVPDSGDGRRLVRRGGSVRAEDGTARPTNKPPLYECALLRSR